MIDTNVFVSAILSANGAPRQVLRLALRRKIGPVMGPALFHEYEDVLSRDDLFATAPLSATERETLLNAFLSVCAWTRIYYLWRPNLRDEADNHVMELAVAANASTIITANVKDFRRAELAFPGVRVASPSAYVRSWEKP